MAQITKKTAKDGSVSYFVRAYKGRDKAHGNKVLTECCTLVPPAGLTPKKAEKWVQEQANQFEQEVRNGLLLYADMTLDELTDKWFEQYIDKKCKPKTASEYRYLRPRISAALGHMKVSDIKPSHLMMFYDNLETVGARKDSTYTATAALLKLLPRGKRQAMTKAAGIGGRSMSCICAGQGVSRATAEKVADAAGMQFSKAFTEVYREGGKLTGNTALHYHRMLSSIFTKAVQWGIVQDNPVKRAEPPKSNEVSVNYLEEDDVKRLLVALQDAPPQFSAIVQLGLFTGMRRGEICGLRWSDIDFERSTITVNRTSEWLPHMGIVFTEPKTKASNRTFKVGKHCFDMLKEYRLYQNGIRRKAGTAWAQTVQIENEKTVQNDLLFTRWDGTPLDLNRVTTWFPKFMQEHDLPAVTVHSLRHTYASLLIAAHVPIVTVAGRLGHAQTSTTTDIYAGFIKSADAAASDTMDAVFDHIKQLKPDEAKQA